MDSLPEELLLQIIERVIELPRTSHWVVVLMRRTLNLHPLVLVSKKFNRIVAPLLYETIRCPYWRTDTFWQNIVNTLRSNPGLARYVKSIETPNTQPLFKNMAPEDLRSILPFDLVSNLYHQSLREFNKRSKHGDNVMLTFLVLESPNLKSLDLRGFERAYRNDVKLLPLVIEEMGRIIYADLDSKAAPRRFETLQCIWLNLDEWGWFPAGSILPFLELPQLKSLTLGAWGGAKSRDEKRCDLYGDARKWPLRTSTIEEVYLYEVFAEPSMVTKLLASCEALKVFECTVSTREEQNLWQWHKQVSTALLDHSSSLERLFIAEPSYMPRQRSKDWFEQPSSLTKLKDMRIPYSILVGDDEPFNIRLEKASNIAERLPVSLERLVVSLQQSAHRPIWDDVDHIIDSISESIYDACVAGSLPSLKGVEIELNEDLSQPFVMPTYQIEAFAALLAARGICLDVSLTCDNQLVSPTRDTMLELKALFPAFAEWSKSHSNLKASTRDQPCIPRRPGMPWYARDDPYCPVYDPWNYEDEGELEEE